MTAGAERQSRDRLAGSRCVVTGGLGFIGSNLTVALLEAGAEVTVIDGLKEGHGGDRANLAGHAVETVIADVGDAAAVMPAVAGADIIFDVAGQVSHLASMIDPERDLALNAIARVRLLEILRRANDTARIVYTSTRQVYGRAMSLPTDESALPRPTDVNGVAKLAGEQLHLLYGSRRRGETVVLRLSNVYGPRQHLQRDDLGVLPVFIRQALRGAPLVVFGSGQDSRDPLHVDDVVEAIIAASLSDTADGLVINIGHEELFTVVELAHLIAASSPQGSIVQREPWPEKHAIVDVGPVQLSLALAARALGWRPRIAFADGVAETLAWFAEHPERFR